MVAIDPNNRQKALDIIKEALKLAAPKEEPVTPKPEMVFE